MSKDECKIENITSSKTAPELQAHISAFNACSKEERRAAITELNEAKKAGHSTSGTESSRIINGFEITYDTVGRKITGAYLESGNPLPPGGGAQSETLTAKTRLNRDAADTGRPGVDDISAQSARDAATDDERKKGQEVAKRLLNGDDVSQLLNDAPRDSRRTIMAVAMGTLADTPGVTVHVQEETDIDGNRYIAIGKDKVKMLVTESKFGLPRDIQVNTGSLISRFAGAYDVYDRPGEAEQKKAAKEAEEAAKPNWRDRLVGRPIAEGNGPMARMLSGDSLSAEELADLKKQGLIYDAKSRGADD